MSRDDVILVIVGGASGHDGDHEAQRARALAAELGLDDRVRFVPPRPHHILSSYYRAADVVLVPSRSESFGLVALEAAACGVPVVASAVGGLLNVVHDGVTGVLVDGRDPGQVRAGDRPAARRSGRRGGDGGRGGRAGQALHVELHRGAAAPSLRRPRRPAGAPARRLLVSSEQA